MQEPSPPVIHDRYQIVSLIASGGLGHVYYGWDLQLHRAVAIKRLRADAAGGEARLEAAWTEARTLAAMQHPNIVTLYDFGVDAEGAFYVLEYVEGETLEAVAERAPLAVPAFLEVARQSLEAVRTAHQAGIIHRDLKPGNIMLKPGAAGRAEVKVLDFGLARFQETPRPQTVDQDKTITGSIHFVAPEQFEGGAVDARTDLYMLGNVFYYALTGRHAHGGRTIHEVIQSHLSGKFVPLRRLRPDVDPRLARWIERLMQRHPAARPASAAEALQKLDFPVEVPPPRGSWPRFSMVAVSLLIAAPALFWLWKSQTRPAPVPQPASAVEAPQAAAEPPAPVLPEKGESGTGTEGVRIAATDLEALRAHLGETVTVHGTLADYGENKGGTICYLNFSKDYRKALALVFFKADNADFTAEKLRPYVGRTVEVRGKVSEHKGALQMKVWTLGRIEEKP